MGNGCSSEKSLHAVEDTVTNNLSIETNNNKRKSLLTKERENLTRHDSTSTTSTTDGSENVSKRNSLVMDKELSQLSYQKKYEEFERSRKTGIMERGFGNHLLGNHLLKNIEENNKLDRWNSFDSDLNKDEKENQFYLEIGDVETQDTKNTFESKFNNIKESTRYNNKTLKANPRKPSLVPSNTSSYDSSYEDNEWLTALKTVFTKFAKFGQILASGKEMYQISWKKFCKDCKFVDNTNLVTGDIDIIFIKNRVRGQRYIDFSAFMKCVDEIADRKLAPTCKDPLERREIVYKRIMGVDPDLKGVTQSSKSRNVRRMTDHNLYPIIHKLRFDETRNNINDLTPRYTSLANLNNQTASLNRRRTSILSLTSSDMSSGSPPVPLNNSKLSTLASWVFLSY